MTWSAFVLRFFELVGIAGLAVTEPTLNILHRGASYLSAFRLRRRDLFITTAIVALVPSAVVVGLERLIALGNTSAADALHVVVIAVLTAFFVNGVAKQATKLRVRIQLIVLVVAAIAFGALYALVGWAQVVLVALVPVVLFVAVRFLRSEPIRRCVVQYNATQTAPRIGNPQRVVLVVFDELPLMSLLDGAGQVSPLFPHFAELAQTSTWFRNTATISAGTRKAVPAIVTGRYPRVGLLPTSADHPDSLFSLLESSYTLNVHEGPTQLTTRSTASSVAGGWPGLTRSAFRLCVQYNSPLQRDDGFFGDRRLFEYALAAGQDFADSLVPSSEPVLDFLHILLPHRPWHYCADGRDYDGGVVEGGSPEGYRSAPASRAARQRHLLQVQTADWLLGRIVQRLRDIDAYDDAVVVVTADHGCGIRPGQPLRRATAENYDEVLWVPLFVKGSGQRDPVVDDRPALTIDIVPTIAEHLDADLGWDVEGRAPSSAAPASDRELVGTLILPAGIASATAEAVREASQGFDRAAGFAQVLAANVAPGAEASGPYGFYQPGPYGHLVGRLLRDLSVESSDSLTGTIETRGRVDKIRPDARLIPWTFVSGEIAGRGEGHDEVVIAVNGQIAGVAALRKTGDRAARFQSLLVPELFAAGRNELELAVVTGPADAPVVTMVRTTARTSQPSPSSSDAPDGVPSGLDAD